MAVFGAISTPLSSSSSSLILKSKSNPRSKIIHVQRTLIRVQFSNSSYSPPPLSTFCTTHSTFKRSLLTHSSAKASTSSSSSSVGSSEYIVEPATEEKFQTSLSLPGCSNSMFVLGTGYREKVFAIIGVKVYAAGFYLSEPVIEKLNAWKGQQAAEIQGNSSLYDSIYQAPTEKSLQIVLVRDVDGKTFWGALDEAISPRIKAATPGDESALSTFRSIFQGRPLKKGTLIFLTWLEPSKMLVCISADGLPSTVDATIKSMNVTSALFDVFFGEKPVSPSLKASVSNGLAAVLY